MMVTHFSLGSALSNQGFSMSSLRIRLEWKYRWDRSSKRAPMALDEPKLEAGRETAGVPNGFVPIGVPAMGPL